MTLVTPINPRIDTEQGNRILFENGEITVVTSPSNVDNENSIAHLITAMLHEDFKPFTAKFLQTKKSKGLELTADDIGIAIAVFTLELQKREVLNLLESLKLEGEQLILREDDPTFVEEFGITHAAAVANLSVKTFQANKLKTNIVMSQISFSSNTN